LAGLYIHIPFCRQACHYCDFHFSTNLQSKSQLVNALAKEIEGRSQDLKEQIETIYFGGGTPSMLSEADIQGLLEVIQTNLMIIGNPEITLEANPDDLNLNKLKSMIRLGINRLSIGLQSFDDKILLFLNRTHSSTDSLQALEFARMAGFENISIDLIYGISHRSHSEWERELMLVADLAPAHISAYCLTVEKGTALYQWTKKGKYVPSGEAFEARQFELTMKTLENQGYRHYEISNFARPGYESRHNQNYWKKGHYVGIGPSAHSYDGHSRRINLNNNFRYIEKVNDSTKFYSKEMLTRENHINEYIMTSLRTQEGCDLKKLYHEYDIDLMNNEEKKFSDWKQQGFITLDGDRIQLTRKGKMVADQLVLELMQI